ncbi:MAG: endo-1,4-beta-xylanase [Treponema sp.]|nr:endo-1,4-beta-xylanase [Treponema sp.]
MKLKGVVIIWAFVLVSCINQHEPVTGITLEKSTLTLTMFASEQLDFIIQPPDATNRNVTWTSSAPEVVYVTQDGIVTALNFTSDGNIKFNTGEGTSIAPVYEPAAGSAIITVTTADGGYQASITIYTTMAGTVDILDLPPIKDQFAGFFMMGNILRNPGTAAQWPNIVEVTGIGTNARIINQGLVRHFNAITAENHMKPSFTITGRDFATGDFIWNIANRSNLDNFLYAAEYHGMEVIGHTLLWHSQNAAWMWRDIATQDGTAIATREEALEIMEAYITEKVGHFTGRIHTWDVLNEIFPNNAPSGADWRYSMRSNLGHGAANPWFAAIGYDFVYYGFLFARRADPNAILYYNDYNTDMPNRARLIRDMVQYVNDRYLANEGSGSGRLLIEGIGMQEHHNLGITPESIQEAINLFRTLNIAGRNPIRLSVSELDILAYQNWSAFQGNGVGQASNSNHLSTVTNDALAAQARRFYEFFLVYLRNADIIERVSFWGINDNTSWRSSGLPLIFDHLGRAKPAYFRIIEALEYFKQTN